MNFADCCTNELQFRICLDCKRIQHTVHKAYDILTTFAIVFVINVFINVCNYISDVFNSCVL